TQYRARKAHARQQWERFPVSGISAHDAERYAAWLDATHRVPRARLCSEKEWERAARGADDREFPHGDRLRPDEANFDETYDKEMALMALDEAKLHPTSRSPYGLYDMSGNVWEWVRSSLRSGEYAVRGGGFYHDANSARVANRQVYDAQFRDVSVGLR